MKFIKGSCASLREESLKCVYQYNFNIVPYFTLIDIYFLFYTVIE